MPHHLDAQNFHQKFSVMPCQSPLLMKNTGHYMCSGQFPVMTVKKYILQVKTVFWVWPHWEFVTRTGYFFRKAVDGILDL